jgi:hypothetical protein
LYFLDLLFLAVSLHERRMGDTAEMQANSPIKADSGFTLNRRSFPGSIWIMPA